MASAERPCALVVEDDEHILLLLTFILEAEGFAVVPARDGKAVRACIERLAPPAVVTLDVMLPDVDGYQVLALLRSRPGWEEVPVLMLSARSQEKDITRARDAGANDYLVKPFKTDELRARVRALLAR